MTPEAQNAALAKFCGWRLDESQNYHSWYSPSGNYLGGATHDPIKAMKNAGVPNYVNDLNAIFYAEDKLTGVDHWDSYADELEVVCSHDGKHASEYAMLHATAAQKSEALLKALGLWTE